MKKSNKKNDNLYVCYCLLKGESARKWGNGRLQQVTEKLYDAQEFYERLGVDNYAQAFVFGNREAALRPFMAYEKGFRAALDENVERYSICDALVLCYGLLEDFISFSEEIPQEDRIREVYRLVIIGDYPLDTNNEAVAILMQKLNELKSRCDFKICYLDADGQNRAGNLAKMIDAWELQ